jgi:hypothetical protein
MLVALAPILSISRLCISTAAAAAAAAAAVAAYLFCFGRIVSNLRFCDIINKCHAVC